jgi:acyl-CoA thioesterase
VIRSLGPGRAELPIEARWCSGDTLFGGALLAALVEAATDLAALPLLSLSATFVARARRPGTVDLALDRLGASRSLVPVRLTATQDDAVVATASTVHAASIDPGRLGRAAPPPVRRPDDCPPRTYQLPVPGSISDELDVRIAGAAPDELRGQVWARWPAAGDGSLRPAVLALLSDHIPFAPRLVLGDEWSGTTLDATLRVLPGLEDIAADAWVLLDLAFDLLGDLAHGTVWLWSADGGPGGPPVPLGIGTQTLRVRRT